MRPRSTIRIAACGTTALLLTTALASAQTQYSIDYRGPTISAPDSAWFSPITEGDVLLPFGGVPAYGPPVLPRIDKAAGPGGLVPINLGLAGYAACVGHPPGMPCTVEVDALSHGLDNPMDPLFPYPPVGMLRFSVDEYATGIPTGFPGPDVFSEAPAGDASADVFSPVIPFPGPMPPFAIPPLVVAVIDGDGLPSASGFVYPGVGLVEPNPPTGGPGATPGDNLDALDEETPPGVYPAFFSLGGGIVDPYTGAAGTGSAAFHGFAAADILISFGPGAPPAVFAPAPTLGLDIFGPGTDDLDALILWENGTGLFEPSPGPYAWTTGATDMVLFSVRRGSAVIGMLDSVLGIPIEEGDVLIPPLAGGPPTPGILFAAENLGLATARSGVPADELDALDARFFPDSDCDGDGLDDLAAVLLGFLPDCNGNGVPDACDLASGISTDFNGDGIPDECGPGTVLCAGDGSAIPCPCGNNSAAGAGEGCANSTGSGAILYTTGTTVVANDDLRFHIAQARPGQPALLVQGATYVTMPFRDGVFCTGNPTARVEVVFLDGSGNGSTTGSIVTNGLIPANGGIRRYQMWYRDPAVSPCGTGSNFSQGIAIHWI